MSPTKRLLIATVGVSVGLVSTVAHASTYFEPFLHPQSQQNNGSYTTSNNPYNPGTPGNNNNALGYLGWFGYRGSTATSVTTNVPYSPNPRLGVSPLRGADDPTTLTDTDYGFLFSAHRQNTSMIFAAYRPLNTVPTSNIIVSGLNIYNMSWLMAIQRGSSAPPVADVVVRVLVRDANTGAWFASDTDYADAADEGTHLALQANNFPHSITFNTSTLWRPVTLIPGTALSVGGTSAAHVAGTQYDAIGFVIVHPASDGTTNGDTALRIDNLNLVPEPASIGALLGSGLFLLRRRR